MAWICKKCGKQITAQTIGEVIMQGNNINQQGEIVTPTSFDFFTVYKTTYRCNCGEHSTDINKIAKWRKD